MFEIYTTLSAVCVASYTSQLLPCLNANQVAVKVILKDQQTLGSVEFSELKFMQFKTDLMATRALHNSYVI
ncbi:hypothetical protein SAMN05216262_103178 [Colwellia chukchiensis]|uniref:Uncharacterized protein n=1 Tax=Colwellia chukchiensis TaxID=641665 RepID=A0A1H7KKP6_9GAMM|nr:hypothetical protein SAMN05216262_103178 [Colwellia chukchiensis]